MIREWLASHLSLTLSVISGVVVATLIAVVAVVSTGYTAQRLDLGDGSVWVANSQQQAIGRANTEVLELNTVVPSTGNDIEVLQQGATVLLVDRTENKVDIVDAATSEVTDSVALPPNQPEVLLGGTRVAVFEQGTGELWLLAAAAMATFDAEAESTLSLGTDAIVSMDPAGMLYAYSPAAGVVYRVNAAASDAVDGSQPVTVPGSAASRSITSVDGQWAILDTQTQTLVLDGRSVDLSSALASGTGPVLQQPAVAGDRVLVGYSGGLVAVALGSGDVSSVFAGTAGTAARPLNLAGCDYAAWSNGQNWRQCGSEPDATARVLASMPSTARLSFDTNGVRAVLNDRRSGATWAVQREGELIDNWDDLITADDQTPQEDQNNQETPPEVEKVQQPPVALDDEFGARPGRSTVLPVLLNDYDPNGDVLVVSELTPIDEAVGRIDLITERQQIQLTLAPGASGQLSFVYAITDGRGGTATATVVVTVRGEAENSPPEQVRESKAVVETGGRVTSQVLSDWVDPDGDAFYLTSAAVAAPDSVSYKPGGAVVFTDAGGGGDLKLVTLVVSDGSAEATGTLAVSVKGAGEVPIVAEPFVVLAYAGQELTVSPLDHVRGGSGIVRLNSVPAKADMTITPSYETGTFRFTSTATRSHYLEYVVTDGTLTVTGLVRVDVASPPDVNTKPITVPKTVFVKTLRNERIDVAGTDVDPAGGVLLVTGIANLPLNSGVRAEVLEQRLVRVSLEAPLDGPVTFNYRISNGLAEAEGVITVIEIPTPTQVQAPIANDDSVTVRVGQAIDIPVLRNDEHPDGLDLILLPTLDQQLPANSGLLFASGNVLRYLAPERTGNFTATYRVTGPDGQAATAVVRIAVREEDVATNNAPVPSTVTARVLAGETVRITIPLTGIDPDGDSVQLLGQSSNPEKGAVIDTQSDTIVYQAGDYSAGTDTFTYAVIDSLGARSTGTVRVGISPRLAGARNPVAIVDEVTVRPGVTVSVQVLANDSDPDGSPMTIVSAEPNDAVTTAEIVGDLVQVTPPRTPGTYGVIYSIENDSGGTSQNFIRITVSADAALAYPLVSDTVLTLSDVLDRDQVTVDVLANVFFADGDPRTLGLSIYPGYGANATVTPGKRIVVDVGKKSQIIPFRVSHPDDDSVVSYGFIRVPGSDDALPQLDRRAPTLRVVSESQLVIDLNDYVIAVGGKQVRLTDPNSVTATHSDGTDLVRDEDTLIFTSADKYFGSASISFEVTDGSSPSDPTGRKSILVLPISVLPRDNQPPVFRGAVISFEPGQEKVIDLLKLTNYPYPDDVAELVYSILEPLPVGFSYALNGSQLTLRADDNAVKGSATAMTLGVRDDITDGQAGRIELSVVPSTRPLVRPGADQALVKRGATTVVDVLANDEATNPFVGQPLRVVDIRGLDGDTLPAGVDIIPSSDKSSLTVTVSSTAAPGDMTLQYQVADATNDPDRFVWGQVTISVQDRPDPVTNLTATGFGDREISLRWNAGAFNNSPIIGYRVVVSTTSGSNFATVTCTGTTCTVPTPGNGSSNAVRFLVVASNAIGDSDAVSTGSGVWSDIIPPAPGGLSAEPVDHGLNVSWSAVTTPSPGTPVTSYLVAVGGVSTSVACSTSVCSSTIVDASLTNGTLVTYSVSARNDAYGPLAAWNTTSQQGTPAGPPLAIAAPVATSTSDTSIGLDWSASFSANGRAISDYTAAIYTGAAPSCSGDGTVTDNGATLYAAGTSTSRIFTGLSPEVEYTLVVFAYNGQGCTQSQAVIARTPPPVVVDLSVSGPSANGSVFDFALDGIDVGGGLVSSGYSVYYRLNGGTEYGPISLPDFLAAEPLQFGQPVSAEVRACRDYSGQLVCQPTMSTAFPLGVPVDPRVIGPLTFTQDDPADPRNDGAFAWLGFPSGSYELVEFACGTAPGDGIFSAAGGDLTCHVDATPSQTPWLTIRVTANGGQTYTISYNGLEL
ncbi:MAG: Ig-like domain-containing protein [Rhodoglobus sp.]